jgi:hypothetical protein
VRYLETLEREQGGGGGGFSATHPKAGDRITKLKAQAGAMGARDVPDVRVKRFAKATKAL